MSGRRRGPTGVVEQVDFGKAELLPDADRPSCWTLLIDGAPQSCVDVGDPTRLEFEYVRRLASVLDLAAPPGAPLRVLHLGGGALTLPRYVAATRPGALQRVVERDAALIELVRRVLPLPRGADLRVRAADARAVVEQTAPGRFDVVIGDVYGGSRMPASLASSQFARAVARLLRPGGCYAVNVADGPTRQFVRGQVATMAEVFADLCLMAEPGTLRGRRFGNFVIVGVLPGGRLPVDELARSATRDPFPARLLHGAELDRFVAGARAFSDETATASPEPPPRLLSRAP